MSFDALSTSISGLSQANNRVAQTANKITSQSEVRADDLVDLKTAELEAKANAAAARTASEVSEELLDSLAPRGSQIDEFA